MTTSDARFRFDDKMNYDFHPRSPRGHGDARRALAESEQAELIRRLIEADLAFAFKHALVQETVYSSLMKHDRKRLHRVVAQELENAYPTALDENAARLAQHYAEAGEDAKTAEYATRAGDVAMRVYAHPEARIHYALALEALGRLPENDENRRRHVDTLIKQVTVSLRAEGPQESLERMRQAEALVAQLPESESNRLRLARIHYWMGHAYVHGNEPGLAIQYMQKVLPIAQELQDPELLAIPSSIIGRALGMQGQFARGAALLNQALPALEQVENWQEWIIAKAFQGFTFALQGQIGQALEAGQDALARATALKTMTGIGQCHLMLTLVNWMGGDGENALKQATLARTVAKHAGDNLLLCFAAGGFILAHARLKDYAAVEQDNAELEMLLPRIGGRMGLSTWFSAAYAENLVRLHRVGEARTLAEKIGQEARALHDGFSQGLAERVLGEAHGRADAPDWNAAEGNFATALQLFQECGAVLEVARTHVAWGYMLRERGEIAPARKHFEKAGAQFETSGLTREWSETRTMMD